MTQWSRRVLVLIFLMVTSTEAGAAMIDGVDVEGDVAAPVALKSSASPRALVAPPDAIVIDFDAFPAPCGFNRATALRDEFVDLGVFFDGPGELDGGAILDECGSFDVSGYSSPNFLAFNKNSQMPDGGTARNPETLLFDPLVSLVEVIVGSSTSQGQLLTLTAFGPDGDLVDEDSLTLTPELQAVSVAARSIREVVISGPDTFVLDDLAFVEAAIEVDVDIKPRNHRNRIRPTSRGLIQVAILGSESFDVADVATLAFGPSGASRAHSRGPHFRDLNRDGWTDLLAHFRSNETGIEFGQMEACISGATLDGTPFEGCDAISTVPDMDGDGLRNRLEKRLGTDPLNPDTDGDGFGDGAEVLVTETNPLDSRDLPPPPLE